MARKPILNHRQKVFAQTYAETGRKDLADLKAGYSTQTNALGRSLLKPHVAETVRQIQERRLNNDLLPKALSLLEHILENKESKDRDKITAAKIIVDRTIGMGQDATANKAAEDMTQDELAARIALLRARQAALATPILDAEIADEPSPDGGVFD